MKATNPKDYTIESNSMIDDQEDGYKSKFIRPYRRQGALNDYNIRRCEFLLN